MVFTPSASAALGVAASAGVSQSQVRFDTAPTASSSLPSRACSRLLHRRKRTSVRDARGQWHHPGGRWLDGGIHLWNDRGNRGRQRHRAGNLPDFNPNIFALRIGHSPWAVRPETTMTPPSPSAGADPMWVPSWQREGRRSIRTFDSEPPERTKRSSTPRATRPSRGISPPAGSPSSDGTAHCVQRPE